MSAAALLHAVDAALGAWSEALARACASSGRLDRARFEAHQPEAMQLARSLAEAAAAHALERWAADGPLERALADRYTARVGAAIEQRLRYHAPHADTAGWAPELAAWIRAATATEATAAAWRGLSEVTGGTTGAVRLEEEHQEIRAMFARFSDERIAPIAERVHREDLVLPEDLLREMAGLGVFGISIPEQYGGAFVDHLTMCLATEELSRGSLGAGGSVITRPEICAKAILVGGSDAQKQRWLPAIASGERIVSVAVTEPNAGSDVASLRVTARPTEVDGVKGWRIDGEKTWCTFAGRADVFILLARTGAPEDGHRGLTLFLVEKPPKVSADDHHAFRETQPHGGSIEGHAIPTIGYRGMHSFAVAFDDWFVPDANRVGALGEGFKLQMAGFAGGRIQTAARAVGVMEAAYRAARRYAADRQVFGQPLDRNPLTQATLVDMAATIQASRQLCYAVAGQMDEGGGHLEASLVKLLSCRDAESVTRDAMQLHGGMGYSEEYAVSRYWQDARVLSIFEGAEEVLALYVVARPHLSDTLLRQGA